MKRPVLIVAVALAAAVVLALCFLGPGARGARTGASLSAKIETEPDAELERLSLPPVDGAGDDASSASPALDPASFAQRVPIDPRLRIAGRVVVEGGLPEEEIRIVTQPKRRSGASPTAGKHRAWVAPDGSFEFLVGANTGPLLLDLDAPSLRLPRPVRIRPGNVDVVLRPEPAATLEVQLLRRGGLLPGPDSWRGVDAMLSGVKIPGLAPRQRVLTASPDDAGRLFFTSLATGFAFGLQVDSPQGPPEERTIDPLAPGEHRRLELVLARGVSIAGLVLDQDGVPVQGANVSASSKRTSNDAPIASTDAAGRFELVGLPLATSWELAARAADLLECTPLTVPGDAGDQAGLVIRAERGLVFQGSVHWPDGSPVNGRLRVERVEAADSSEESWIATEGDLTRFQLCRSPGLYDLDVRATRNGWVGNAVLRHVQPGGPPLDLVLVEERTFALTLTAFDLSGTPLPAFTAVCRLPKDIERGKSSSEGELVFAGLPAGTYELEVRADDCYPSTRLVQVGPGHTDPVAFVLSPCGLVRGRVVDASGNPVPGARVQVQGKGGFSCEDDGRFEVPLSRNRGSLYAFGKGHVRSAAVQVEVPSSGVLAGVLLQLGERARPEGR